MNRNQFLAIGAVAAAVVLLAGAVKADVIYATGTGDNVYKITADGTVTTFATLPSFPNGVAVDRQGNVFVALGDAGTVDKITPDGTVSPFASGLGTPDGLAFDQHGTLYASGLGHIDAIAPDGSVKPFYTFPSPHGSGQLAFDEAGNAFVASNSGNDITKITPDAQATTFAKIVGTLAVAVDSKGNVYTNHVIEMPQTSSSQIVRLTPSGSSSVVAAMGARGMAIGSNDTLYYSSVGGIYALGPDGQTHLFANLTAPGHIAVQVPEPSSLLLLIAFGAGVGLRARRRTVSTTAAPEA